MIEEQDRVNLALIGFMGTGKSSVGRLVAHRLDYSFLDTDDLIQALAGKSIAEIFAQDGEAVFRQLERDVLAGLNDRTRTVIATGGGMGADEENLARLKQHAYVVCLWSSPEGIFERVCHQNHRPLLHDPNPLERIRDLLEARGPVYRKADALVNTERRSVKEVAQQVIHHFQLRERQA